MSRNSRVVGVKVPPRCLLHGFTLGLLLFAGNSLAAGEDVIRQDLLDTITLEGYSCGEVIDAEPQAIADYLVTCTNHSRFHVRLTPAGRIEVVDLDRPASAGAPAPPTHLEIVAKMLTAVVHLADAGCGLVVHVVRQGPADHIASCRDGQRYRVKLSATGETTVDAQ